ncbi:HPP family protein [Paraburkholderia sp. DHOC27]|uniref:HPP family protein n=1 Tax=Paraburkholderia sp. DHOC27 TaxID=2303330 RepID=UPI000E3DAFD5|nr:HPP family protein [Paraburkholderia sp. DHOC27]RFU49082.1 HPP family protein [Paraburkholderia sp. DHOC27]
MTAGFILMGELITLFLLGGTSKLALAAGVPFLLFPELSALSFNVFSRPKGAWASAPGMLIITPTAAATIGVLITRNVGYGPIGVVLCIASAVVLLRLLRSPIAPAISAGFLPMALGFTSWQYPASIAFVTILLAISSLVYRKLFSARLALVPSPAQQRAHPAAGLSQWLPPFIAFLLLAYSLGALTGMRLILFPPLVVIGYEMFVHPDTCPWARHPWTVIVVSTISAAVGLAAVALIGVGPASVVAALIAGMAVLRIFRLNFPPALAISLLPQVITPLEPNFILAVALGSAVLTVTFLVTRARPRVAAPSGSGSRSLE